MIIIRILASVLVYAIIATVLVCSAMTPMHARRCTAQCRSVMPCSFSSFSAVELTQVRPNPTFGLTVVPEGAGSLVML